MRITDPQQAYLKARTYCAYQERSQQEVRDRLYDWGMHKKEVEEIIARLVTDGFINEERFAKAFAGGKFRIKKWGRNKIIRELKEKKVSDYCIRKAMEEIDDSDYFNVMREIITKKSKETKEKNPLKKKYAVAKYVISRGFEAEYVWKILKE